jgi:hypothetical protein
MSNLTVVLLYGMGILVASVTTLDGPYYYSNWSKEHTLFTSVSSLQLFIAALAAVGCLQIARYHQRNRTCGVRRPWMWLPISIAFAFASGDEILCLHERMGNSLNNSVSWFDRLYYRCSDDIFLLLYGIGAVVFTLFFMRELRLAPRASRYYVAGLAALIFASLMDYLPWRTFGAGFPVGTEELAEYFAGISFSISFILYAIYMSRLALVDWLESITVSRPKALSVWRNP